MDRAWGARGILVTAPTHGAPATRRLRRFASLALVTGASALLGGCPVFPSGPCYDDLDCGEGYYCSDTGACRADGTCTIAFDCRSGELCSEDGLCVSADCSTVSCPGGYVCAARGESFVCTPAGGMGGDGGSSLGGSPTSGKTPSAGGVGAGGSDGAAGSGLAGASLGGALAGASSN